MPLSDAMKALLSARSESRPPSLLGGAGKPEDRDSAMSPTFDIQPDAKQEQQEAPALPDGHRFSMLLAQIHQHHQVQQQESQQLPPVSVRPAGRPKGLSALVPDHRQHRTRSVGESAGWQSSAGPSLDAADELRSDLYLGASPVRRSTRRRGTDPTALNAIRSAAPPPPRDGGGALRGRSGWSRAPVLPASEHFGGHFGVRAGGLEVTTGPSMPRPPPSEPQSARAPASSPRYGLSAHTPAPPPVPSRTPPSVVSRTIASAREHIRNSQQAPAGQIPLSAQIVPPLSTPEPSSAREIRGGSKGAPSSSGGWQKAPAAPSAGSRQEPGPPSAAAPGGDHAGGRPPGNRTQTLWAAAAQAINSQGLGTKSGRRHTHMNGQLPVRNSPVDDMESPRPALGGADGLFDPPAPQQPARPQPAWQAGLRGSDAGPAPPAADRPAGTGASSAGNSFRSMLGRKTAILSSLSPRRRMRDDYQQQIAPPRQMPQQMSSQATTAADGRSGAPAVGRWEVALHRRHANEKFGMDIAPLQQRAWKVVLVKAGGIVDKWNSVHPQAAVIPGDIIAEVNGVKDDIDMMMEQLRQPNLNLTVERVETLSLRSSKEGEEDEEDDANQPSIGRLAEALVKQCGSLERAFSSMAPNKKISVGSWSTGLVNKHINCKELCGMTDKQVFKMLLKQGSDKFNVTKEAWSKFWNVELEELEEFKEALVADLGENGGRKVTALSEATVKRRETVRRTVTALIEHAQEEKEAKTLSPMDEDGDGERSERLPENLSNLAANNQERLMTPTGAGGGSPGSPSAIQSPAHARSAANASRAATRMRSSTRTKSVGKPIEKPEAGPGDETKEPSTEKAADNGASGAAVLVDQIASGSKATGSSSEGAAAQSSKAGGEGDAGEGEPAGAGSGSRVRPGAARAAADEAAQRRPREASPAAGSEAGEDARDAVAERPSYVDDHGETAPRDVEEAGAALESRAPSASAWAEASGKLDPEMSEPERDGVAAASVAAGSGAAGRSSARSGTVGSDARGSDEARTEHAAPPLPSDDEMDDSSDEDTEEDSDDNDDLDSDDEEIGATDSIGGPASQRKALRLSAASQKLQLHLEKAMEEAAQPEGEESMAPGKVHEAKKYKTALERVLAGQGSEEDYESLTKRELKTLKEQQILQEHIQGLDLDVTSTDGIATLVASILKVKLGSYKRKAFQYFDVANQRKFPMMAWDLGMNMLRINMEVVTGINAERVFALMNEEGDMIVTWKEWKKFFKNVQEDITEKVRKGIKGDKKNKGEGNSPKTTGRNKKNDDDRESKDGKSSDLDKKGNKSSKKKGGEDDDESKTRKGKKSDEATREDDESKNGKKNKSKDDEGEIDLDALAKQLGFSPRVLSKLGLDAATPKHKDFIIEIRKKLKGMKEGSFIEFPEEYDEIQRKIVNAIAEEFELFSYEEATKDGLGVRVVVCKNGNFLERIRKELSEIGIGSSREYIEDFTQCQLKILHRVVDDFDLWVHARKKSGDLEVFNLDSWARQVRQELQELQEGSTRQFDSDLVGWQRNFVLATAEDCDLVACGGTTKDDPIVVANMKTFLETIRSRLNELKVGQHIDFTEDRESLPKQAIRQVAEELSLCIEEVEDAAGGFVAVHRLREGQKGPPPRGGPPRANGNGNEEDDGKSRRLSDRQAAMERGRRLAAQAAAAAEAARRAGLGGDGDTSQNWLGAGGRSGRKGDPGATDSNWDKGDNSANDANAREGTVASIIENLFDRFATGNFRGERIFLRFPDLRVFVQEVEANFPGASSLFAKVEKQLEEVFNDTIQTQIDMDARTSKGLLFRWFQVFIQSAMRKVGESALGLIFKLGSTESI